MGTLHELFSALIILPLYIDTLPQAGTRLVQAVVKVSSMGSVVRVARWLEENMELVVGGRIFVIWSSTVVTFMLVVVPC